MNLKTWMKGNTVFHLGFICSILGIFFAPFLASLGVAFFLVYIVLYSTSLFEVPLKSIAWASIPLFWSFTDILRDGFTQTIQGKLLLNLGFGIMALAMIVYFQKKGNNSDALFFIFIILLALVNLFSVLHYAFDKDTFDALLLESKSIPVFGGMHHIHFGIINALSILALVFHFWQNVYSKNQLKIAWVLWIVIFISFHILSSRTGLVSFYVTIGFCAFMHFSMNKNWKLLIASVLVIMIAPIGFYWLSTSLQNKMINTLDDIKTWNSPNREDINHQSMAMRIEAYKAAIFTIKNNGFFGVGAERMEQEIFESFKKINTPLTFENQKMPHNQFLESTVKYGILGILGVLYLFILPIIKMSRKPSFLLIFGIILCLVVSSMLESLLERQVSVFIIVYFVQYAFSLSDRRELNKLDV